MRAVSSIFVYSVTQQEQNRHERTLIKPHNNAGRGCLRNKNYKTLRMGVPKWFLTCLRSR